MLTAADSVTGSFMNDLKPYVLLVDDHEPSLHQLQQVLAHSGFCCTTARCAREAMDAVEQRRPQVVVTDLVMPNLDGYGLADWLRLRYPSVAMILMTGEDLDASAQAALQPTFIAVMSKPLDVDRLLKLLDRLMPSDPAAARP